MPTGGIDITQSNEAAASARNAPRSEVSTLMGRFGFPAAGAAAVSRSESGGPPLDVNASLVKYRRHLGPRSSGDARSPS